MPRTCVVGGGPAGVQAALAGAYGGASVTLFERLGRLPSPMSSWPSILDGQGPRGPETERTLTEKGIDLRLGETVAGVRPDLTVVTSSGGQRFSSVVVASGGVPVSATPLPQKPGVHVLASEGSYAALREASLGYSKVLVTCGGTQGLLVAGALHRKGIEVFLSTPRGLLSDHFPPMVREMVRKEAVDLGIAIHLEPLRRIVGEGKVEAAVVGSGVLPCDGAAVIPRFVPWSPPLPASRGAAGGILVGRRMETSAAGVFAAGKCAEYRLGPGSRPVPLEGAASSSGWIAGINASGGSLARRPLGCFSSRLLGVSIRSAGLSQGEAAAAGMRASEASTFAGETFCSVVYEAMTRRTLGIHLATRGAAPQISTMALAASEGVLLDDLASLEASGSTDISAVVETAREGIREWRRS